MATIGFVSFQESLCWNADGGVRGLLRTVRGQTAMAPTAITSFLNFPISIILNNLHRIGTPMAERPFTLRSKGTCSKAELDRQLALCVHSAAAPKNKEQIGFERQKQEQAVEIRKQEAHDSKMEIAKAKLKKIEIAQGRPVQMLPAPVTRPLRTTKFPIDAPQADLGSN